MCSNHFHPQVKVFIEFSLLPKTRFVLLLIPNGASSALTALALLEIQIEILLCVADCISSSCTADLATRTRPVHAAFFDVQSQTLKTLVASAFGVLDIAFVARRRVSAGVGGDDLETYDGY